MATEATAQSLKRLAFVAVAVTWKPRCCTSTMPITRRGWNRGNTPMKVSIAYVTAATNTFNSFSRFSSVKSGRSASRVPNNSLDMRWASSPKPHRWRSYKSFRLTFFRVSQMLGALPTESVQRTVHDSITDGFALHALAKQQTQHASKAPTKRIEGTCPTVPRIPSRTYSLGYPTPTEDVRRQISEGCLTACWRIPRTRKDLPGHAWIVSLDGRKSMTSSSTSNSSTTAKKMPWPSRTLRSLPSLRDEVELRIKDKRFRIIRDVVTPPEEPRTDWSTMRSRSIDCNRAAGRVGPEVKPSRPPPAESCRSPITTATSPSPSAPPPNAPPCATRTTPAARSPA